MPYKYITTISGHFTGAPVAQTTTQAKLDRPDLINRIQKMHLQQSRQKVNKKFIKLCIDEIERKNKTYVSTLEGFAQIEKCYKEILKNKQYVEIDKL